MKVTSYSIAVGSADPKNKTTELVVHIPVEDVSAAVEAVNRIREIEDEAEDPPAKPAKGAKGAAAAGKGKKPKKPEPEPEEDEDEDEEAADEDADDEDADDEDADDEDDEEPPAKGKGKGKGAAAATERPKVKLTPALKNAEKLRSVVVELIDQGFKSKKDIVAACVALKDKLAVLKSITDLETRVPRAVELINPKMK